MLSWCKNKGFIIREETCRVNGSFSIRTAIDSAADSYDGTLVPRVLLSWLTRP